MIGQSQLQETAVRTKPDLGLLDGLPVIYLTTDNAEYLRQVEEILNSLRRDSSQHDLPVINRPWSDVSSMFGGLGSSAPSMPRWVRGGQGGQGVYGVEVDPYRPASKDGGYYARGGSIHHTPTAWGSGAGWQTQSQGQNQYDIGRQRDMRGPEHVSRQTYGKTQEHDGRKAGQYYVAQGGQYGSVGIGRQAGNGGGGRSSLSGPTAASM
ncbi:hypothetical protein FGB62_278g01 [Gracilaria domingensis]|nr:hypothetical protein FGB62_278g01 [Gracilaria domingensis]